MVKKASFKLLTILLVISLLALPLMACDGKPLTITIWEPQDGDVFTTSPIAIRGEVSNPGATVKINDDEAVVGRRGVFVALVMLTEGENSIKVVATRGEQVATQTITITYTPSQ